MQDNLQLQQARGTHGRLDLNDTTQDQHTREVYGVPGNFSARTQKQFWCSFITTHTMGS